MHTLPGRFRPTIDWDRLLGAAPDGSQGYTAMSPEGPVSMRQRNLDPMCPTRVVPACRREGSTPTSSCSVADQYFAWPSRRIAEVVRRFDELSNNRNGTLSSICKNDYTAAFAEIAERIPARLTGRCLSQPLPVEPAPCERGDSHTECQRARCVVREVLPPGADAARLCVASRGRAPGGRISMRDTCLVHRWPCMKGARRHRASSAIFMSIQRGDADARSTLRRERPWRRVP
jgi:hypothetical protein